MKRLALALTTVGISISTLAALPAATDPTVVNIPQLPGGFGVGITGYYLQSSSSQDDLDYAIVSPNLNVATILGTSINQSNSAIKTIDPGYNGGYGVNANYTFSGTGNDINLSYFHLDTRDSDSVSSAIIPFPSGAPFISALPISGIDFTPFLIRDNDVGVPVQMQVNGQVDYNLNQVDLTIGQFVNVGCRLGLHPNIGLRWSSLDRKLTTNSLQGFSGTFSEPGFTFSQSDIATSRAIEKSDFDGVGPMIGLDASYYLAAGIGLVDHFDAALAIGDINSDTTLAGTLDTAEEGFHGHRDLYLAVNAANTTRLVPILDNKLGIDYTFLFNNTANSNLTLEAGWQVSNYFNAIDRIPAHITTIFLRTAAQRRIPVDFIITTIGNRTSSDFGINGPYISLQLHI